MAERKEYIARFDDLRQRYPEFQDVIPGREYILEAQIEDLEHPYEYIARAIIKDDPLLEQKLIVTIYDKIARMLFSKLYDLICNKELKHYDLKRVSTSLYYKQEANFSYENLKEFIDVAKQSPVYNVDYGGATTMIYGVIVSTSLLPYKDLVLDLIKSDPSIEGTLDLGVIEYLNSYYDVPIKLACDLDE